MKKLMIFAMVVLCSVVLFGAARAESPEKSHAMLAHDVYFTLKDKSAESKRKLIAACKKYLNDHPGTVRFAVGQIAGEMKRDVNDRDFDVVLLIVFKDKAAHDQYSKAARHQKFIEENADSWAKVRVFDSYLDE
jgi:hypothetical protein